MDAGRFSATRIDGIAGGWSIALSRAAQSGALRLPVTAALISSHEIHASKDPFENMPSDERRSADAIMIRGEQLSQDRSASRISADSPRAFVASLIGAVSAASRLAPPHHRRIVAVYRQAFNYSGRSEETAIIEACDRVRMERMTVLLIGRQVAGASSPSVQLC